MCSSDLYIRKQMATHDDPIRKLAEQGITHMPHEQMGLDASESNANARREKLNAPRLGQSPEAQAWEDATDVSMHPQTVGKLLQERKQFGHIASETEPWMEKADPETKVWKPLDNMHAHYLGFDHIVDVLRQDVREGRIRPEQLSKVSMEQAVRRTYEYDQEMAKKMREAAIKQTEGMPVHKEYPEGYKWIELAAPNYNKLPIEERKQLIARLTEEAKQKGLTPEDYIERYPESQLAEALKYEGNMMGHCVGGYCPDVMEGRSRIYSLRDAKGEPHVTIEVNPSTRNAMSPAEFYQHKNVPHSLLQKINEAEAAGHLDDIGSLDDFVQASHEYEQYLKSLPPAISQIKGKQNRAPKEEYLPFVQDFVQSGQWSAVGDLHNAGLRDMNQDPKLQEYLKQKGIETPRYITQKEYQEHGDDFLMDRLYPPDEGMKRGGRVHISDNADTMMMELAGDGEVKMDKGGDPKKAEQDLWAELRASIPKDSGLGPIENLKQNLSAVYEGAKKVPGNLYNLATNPVEYIKNLPAPTGEQIINAFSPADMGFVGSYKPHTPLKPDPDVGTRYKVTDTGGLAPRKDLNIEDLQGSQVKVFPWDATSRNKLVTEVSDVKLQKPVLTEGGDDYMRDLQHIKKRIAGASNEGIAKRIMDRINEASVENQMLGDGTGRVFGFPIRMGAKAEYASTFPTDIMKDLMEQASLKKAEKKALDESMRNMVFEGKKGVFKDMAPFGSPEFFSQLENGLKSNKEKNIKGFTDMNMRKAFMDRMALVEQQKRLGYNIQDLTGSVLAEELKGVPKGYVGNVAAELDVFGKLRPSQSSTYSHDFPGAYAGSMPNMPVEILMPKTFENIYKEMKIEYPSASKEALRNMTIGAMEKRKNQISEKITQRNIDAVKTYQEGLMKGEFDPNDIKQVYDYMLRKKLQLKMAQGGQVHKAAGGEITADDLTIEERPL